MFYSWVSAISPFKFESALERELATGSVDPTAPQSGKRHIAPLRMAGILCRRLHGIPPVKELALLQFS